MNVYGLMPGMKCVRRGTIPVHFAEELLCIDECSIKRRYIMKKGAFLLALVLLLAFVGVAAADSAERLGYPPYDSEIALDAAPLLGDDTGGFPFPQPPPQDGDDPFVSCKIIEGPAFSYKICYPR
jgi:hypothetical protein